MTKINFIPLPSSPATLSDLANSTLVLPAANNIANIGQLSIDLLIPSLQCQLVGYLDSPDVLPVVGSTAFDENDHCLTTNMEVYMNESKTITIIQQRSPVIPQRGLLYTKDMLQWCLSAIGFHSIVLLSGADASRRIDAQLVAGQFPLRYLHNTSNNRRPLLSKCESFGWKQLEKIEDTIIQDSERPGQHLAQQEHYIPGGGVSKFFYDQILETKPDVEFLNLIWFVTEGDNVGDAVGFVQNIAKVLDVAPKTGKWKIPISWSKLFGNSLSQVELYQ